MAKPYLVLPSDAPRGVDVLELVGRQYATDPTVALQWVSLADPEGRGADNVAKFAATGWARVQESGVDVTVMGMLLMRKSRAAVDAELQAVADKGQKNWDDAVAKFAGKGGSVRLSWRRDPTK